MRPARSQYGQPILAGYGHFACKHLGCGSKIAAIGEKGISRDATFCSKHFEESLNQIGIGTWVG